MKAEFGKNKKVIIRRECDTAMAKKKKMFGHCLQECKSCICCIQIDQDGDREHVSYGNGVAFREGKPAIII